MPTATSPFHLAFPVKDLESTRHFYLELLGCRLGRESDHWIDFDFFGHQISAHLRPEAARDDATSEVDGKRVPLTHFGAILEPDQWQALADRLRQAGVAFVVEPQLRFRGEPGEQSTMFLLDPSGNALEFKSFRDPSQIFARD